MSDDAAPSPLRQLNLSSLNNSSLNNLHSHHLNNSSNDNTDSSAAAALITPIAPSIDDHHDVNYPSHGDHDSFGYSRSDLHHHTSDHNHVLPSPALSTLTANHSYHRSIAHLPQLFNAHRYKHTRNAHDHSEQIDYEIPIHVLLSPDYPVSPPAIALLPVAGFAFSQHDPLVTIIKNKNGHHLGLFQVATLVNWDKLRLCSASPLADLLELVQTYFSTCLPPYVPYDKELINSMSQLHPTTGLPLLCPLPPQQQQQQEQESRTPDPAAQAARWSAMVQWANLLMVQSIPYQQAFMPLASIDITTM